MIAFARLALSAALLLGACAPGPGEDRCAVEKLADVPLTMGEGLPRVTVAINGQPATMLLDTGANAIVITPATGRRLGVVEEPEMRFTATAVGGATMGRAVRLDTLAFAGIELRDQTAAELPVPMEAFGAPALDGILGTSVLNAFDMELDGTMQTLALYRGRFCPGGAIPWPRPYTTLRMAPHRTGAHIAVPVRINGTAATGLIDTGATGSMIDIALARRLGVPESALVPGRALETQGLGPQKGRYWRHRFALVELGGKSYANVDLGVTDLGNEAEMLLGQDFLGGRRLWISPGSETVYIADAPPSVRRQERP